LKPLLGATAISVEASDEQLVGLAQTGNSEAFAVLFRRYRPAVARYAGRILGDDVRAEDVVQEVFLAALRSIGTLDRPAGFKPWLYRIAHNTCVDHVRRNGRAEEISMDAAVLPANEEIRLVRQAPSTHAAVTMKEDFRHLREAFGGLPPAQSLVLVMRELQGLSYEEIALRLGVTRASVESTLFRARQGLKEEYGQISTGERCLRMRPVMARMAEGMGGLRDRRTLARHLRGCQPCRREACAMGLGGAALESSGLRGGLSRVAALLPLPWLFHRRADETDAASSAGAGGGSLAVHAHTAVTNFSVSMSVGADTAATAIHKAVAVVAAVAVVGGGGFVAAKGDSRLGLLPQAVQEDSRARTGQAVQAPALLPDKSSMRLTATPTALTAAPQSQAQEAVTSPLLPTAPSGVPGPIDTLGVPDAVAAPKAADESAPAEEVPVEPEAQTSAPVTEPSLPAAGEVGSSAAPPPDEIPDSGAPAPGEGSDAIVTPDPVLPPEGGAPAPEPAPCDLLPNLPASCPGLETATDALPQPAG
jgi:RNA polymerase sigma factor (sigma-70 family)